MRRLILFRHAKAEPRAAAGQDTDRPLSARGLRDAALMGRVLAADGAAPDLALVSPSLRTRQTWEAAAGALPPTRVEVVDALYNATSEEVAEVLERRSVGSRTVLVVGHNPSLQELSVQLLVDGGAAPGDIERLEEGFPTATAAAFLIGPDGQATFDGVFGPRDAGRATTPAETSGEAF